MLIFRKQAVSIMVMYAISLHLFWAAIILIDDSSVHATAVHALFRYIAPPVLLSAFILFAALLATLGLFTHVPWIVVMLMPQQILLMMSAAGAVEAIWLSQFADGVIRPRSFVAADQIYSILAAFWHTVAIIAHAIRIVR